MGNVRKGKEKSACGGGVVGEMLQGGRQMKMASAEENKENKEGGKQKNKNRGKSLSRSHSRTSAEKGQRDVRRISADEEEQIDVSRTSKEEEEK